MPALSDQEGREVYVDVVILKRFLEGGEVRTYELFKDKEKNYWKEQHPREWEAFERNEVLIDGTPLESFKHNYLTPAMVANLKAMNIDTIERLACATDTTIQGMGMGGRELVKAAQRFTEATGSDKSVSELKTQIEEQQRQIEELKALVKAQMEKPKRGKKNESSDNSESSE